MIEKVNPSHPDKVADRIAGAIVDYAYTQEKNPKVAAEVLIGHRVCHIIVESSVSIPRKEIELIVFRIAPEITSITYSPHKQDVHLAGNQNGAIRCGDNGIFKGMPLTSEQMKLSRIAREIYDKYPTDGKYILDEDCGKLIICQSNAETKLLRKAFPDAIINPLGEWTGGTGVDTGATNRKLGSDMADAVTGGGLHGKDLSKADVSVNIYAHLMAQKMGVPVSMSCAIGDEKVAGKPYSEIVKIARDFVKEIGGFEKLAEWGLY